jgi:MoaA/NifB/PqqE/SkfB family radical SAM enzyme
MSDIQLNVKNFDLISKQPAMAYSKIMFDSNNDCNVHCVYCHNSRSKASIDIDAFRQFVAKGVLSLEVLQLGCVMEPTLDKRLGDFIEAVANSPAAPKTLFRLQTNGILLHRHDYRRMVAAGLNSLAISVDSVRDDVHSGLRGGTSLPKVRRNLQSFHAACPDVRLTFLTTITKVNIGEAGDLVAWGLERGVKQFVFRQMFHFPNSQVVDHARMAELLVSADEFADFRLQTNDRYGKVAQLHFLANDVLVRESRAKQIRSGIRSPVIDPA